MFAPDVTNTVLHWPFLPTSAVAAAGTAAAHHQVSFRVAANGAVLAALTSAFINIPIVARAGGQPGLTKALARSLLIVIAFGVFGLLVHKPLETAFRSVLRIRTRLLQTRIERVEGSLIHTIGGN